MTRFGVMLRYCPVGALSLAAALSFGRTAQAAGDDRAVAETMFAKGRDALKKGDLDGACAAFEESERLDPAPGTMFNLGDCEEKRGHLAAAWQWFAEALVKLPNTDQRRGLVATRAAALKTRVPMLTIRLAKGAPRDTSVVRDSIELRSVSLDSPLPLDPGVHRVVVNAPGHEERRFVVELAEREQKELVVEPGPATPVAPAPTPVPPAAAAPPVPVPPTKMESPPGPSSSSNKRTIGYVVGGVGVAGIGTALVLGGIALGKKSTVSDQCDKTTRTCTQEGLDAASSGSTLSTASTVLFIVGAAATGVGAYLILTGDSSSSTALRANLTAGGADLRLIRRF